MILERKTVLKRHKEKFPSSLTSTQRKTALIARLYILLMEEMIPGVLMSGILILIIKICNYNILEVGGLRDGSVGKRAICASTETWVQISSTQVRSQAHNYQY